MRARIVSIFVAALVAAGCDAGLGQTGGGGAVAGHVTLGPIMPVCRADVPCDGVYKGAKVEVRDRSGSVAALVKSDANGDFRVDVAAGTYTISIVVEGTLPRCGEAEAVVAVGQTARVTIDCDSGIR